MPLAPFEPPLPFEPVEPVEPLELPEPVRSASSLGFQSLWVSPETSRAWIEPSLMSAPVSDPLRMSRPVSWLAAQAVPLNDATSATTAMA